MGKVGCDFYQLGAAGPAAFLPPTILASTLRPVADLEASLKPALRPMLVILPRPGQEDVMRSACNELKKKEVCVIRRFRPP